MNKRMPTAVGKRVLVVDDDRMIRDSVGRVLEDDGYEVLCASDGFEALAHVRTTPPDAILLDLMMPGMNGRQFIEAIRQDGVTRRIPVVVMTAVSGLDIHRTFALDAADVIEKPFDIDQLLNKIALALFRAEKNASVAAAASESEEEGGVVLVIDDDRPTLRSFDALLSERGYNVVALSEISDELPRLARVLEPEAILIDLHLSGENGITALRSLRAVSELDHVPILVFSGCLSSLELAAEEIRNLAAVPRPKPFGYDDLISFVTAPPPGAVRS